MDLLRPYCRQIVAQPAPVRTLARRGRDTLLSPWPDMALRLDSPAMHAHMARLVHENRYDVIQVEGIEMARYVLALNLPCPFWCSTTTTPSICCKTRVSDRCAPAKTLAGRRILVRASEARLV